MAVIFVGSGRDVQVSGREDQLCGGKGCLSWRPAREGSGPIWNKFIPYTVFTSPEATDIGISYKNMFGFTMGRILVLCRYEIIRMKVECGPIYPV
jgi:hypothetical protein